VKFEKSHLTDLLWGIASPIPNSHYHFFLADFDYETQEEIMEKAGKILVEKYRFGNIYLLKSGKGFHLVSFSKRLKLKTYVKILKEMDADPKFIIWIERVKYGILRLSRRSKHMKVPKLIAVLQSPFHQWEDSFAKHLYFTFLNLEAKINTIKRVRVIDNDKEKK
jgi:hypothetical protein